MGGRRAFIALLFLLLCGWALAEFALTPPPQAPSSPSRVEPKPLEDRLLSINNGETTKAPSRFPKHSAKDLLNNDVISSVELDQLKPAPGEIVSPESPPIQLAGAFTPIPTMIPSTPTPQPQSEPQLFTPDEVREIEALSRDGNGSNLRGLGGRVGGSKAGVVTPGAAVPTSTPIKSLLPRVRGQGRGFTALSLMQPEARQATEALIQTLLEAEVETLYLGVLIDGTFSQDFPYLESVVRRLNVDRRSLILALYLSNGPTMRDYETTPITAGFNKIEPAIFRNLIIYDRQTQDEFAALVRRARPIFDLNRTLNGLNQNIAIVMLEDNLDAESYRTMRRIAATELAGDISFLRNPCLGCYEGNDQFTYGDGIESHRTYELESSLTAKDGFSLDGTGYRYPEEPADSALSYEEVRRLLGVSASRGTRYFGLWRTGSQGIQAGVDTQAHPSDRVYQVSTVAQREHDIVLLREGLVEK